MRKNISFVAALVLLLLLGGYILAMSSPGFQINWMVPVSSGGAGQASSTSYAAQVTVGQTAIGSASSDNYKTALGYWPGVQQSYQVYLPVVIKP